MTLPKIMVLHSGGLDSSVLLATAIHRSGVDNVYTLSINYGSKQNDVERLAASRVRDAMGLATDHAIEYTAPFWGDALHPLVKGEVPQGDYSIQERNEIGTVKTYVPFRNGILLSLAAGIALDKGMDVIAYGAHTWDADNNCYPDCGVPFVQSMMSAVYEGTGHKLKLEVPFVQFTKEMIAQCGQRYNVPFDLTYSCYEGGSRHCGKCGTCIDRAKALASIGLDIEGNKLDG